MWLGVGETSNVSVLDWTPPAAPVPVTDVELENFETVLNAAFIVEVLYSVVVSFTTVTEVGIGEV
jgi:hypothetical protein